MAEFLKYAPLLRKLEGGWVDDPADRGGATMAGVTLTTFRRYFGSTRTKEELRNISEAQWNFIMKKYWTKCRADEIENQSVAEIFVDWYVNSGTSGIRNFQRAAGIRDDGVVGPVTLAALNADDSRGTFGMIMTARENFFRRIASRDASQKKFLKGWLNRLGHFKFEK